MTAEYLPLAPSEKNGQHSMNMGAIATHYSKRREKTDVEQLPRRRGGYPLPSPNDEDGKRYAQREDACLHQWNQLDHSKAY